MPMAKVSKLNNKKLAKRKIFLHVGIVISIADGIVSIQV